MTANEIADAIERLEPVGVQTISNMLRQQQAQIEALKEYMKAQDKHIVDLAFKLVYAERGNEVAKELSNEQ